MKQPTHRGTRSVKALAKRAVKWNTAAQCVRHPAPAPVAGETATQGAELPIADGVCIWSVNVRSLRSDTRRAELFYRISVGKPHILALQETWLDNSSEQIHIPGYRECLRCDRSEGKKAGWGGIVVYHRDDCDNLVCIHKSETAERGWCTLTTNLGPILVGNWYRPPDGEESQITTLADELDRFQEDHVGTVLVGDINIHHRKWLVHSNANTNSGQLLQDIATGHNLSQLISHPTRGDYLLDLVLTDMRAWASTRVLPPVADHAIVEVVLAVPVPHSHKIPRRLWYFNKADWNSIIQDIGHFDKTQLTKCSADDGAELVSTALRKTMFRHIPNRILAERKATHPWIDEECEAAIREKATAFGGDSYKDKAKDCANLLRHKYVQYRTALKQELAALPRGSKRWWRLNRELLDKKTSCQTIPPLKRHDKTWATEAVDKANLFACKFRSKSALPATVVEFETQLRAASRQTGFLAIRLRWARKALHELSLNTATGPDGIPARVLRRCAQPLSLLVVILARLFLSQGKWPELWRLHHIIPLFKKGAAAEPGNYRGVHLTSILSKVVERVLARVLCSYFVSANLYGNTQWAFQPERSSKDLVTYCMLCWLWAFHKGKKVGLLLSDISGAFDRVCTPYLVKKLACVGTHEAFLALLSSYLAPRTAKVVVNGSASDPYVIENEVYQGTVLGPPLWNIFFSDVSTAIPADFVEAKFADDLNVFRSFDQGTDNSEILCALRTCQQSIHEWGRVNRVTFDPSKEHMVVLSRSEPSGETFKFLGPLIDGKLTMVEEIGRIRGKTRPKVKAILRMRSFYNTASLIMQFKAHALPHIEGSTGAVFHASSTQLSRIDVIQESFIRELGISDRDAFLQHNLAPSRLRRNIAALGLIHKVVIGKAHPALKDFFPSKDARSCHPTRLSTHRHTQQVQDFCDGSQSQQFQHSLFGMVKIYNLLPQRAVDQRTVTAFQKFLTRMARDYAQRGNAFQDLFCPRQIRPEGLNNCGVLDGHRLFN